MTTTDSENFTDIGIVTPSLYVQFIFEEVILMMVGVAVGVHIAYRITLAVPIV